MTLQKQTFAAAIPRATFSSANYILNDTLSIMAPSYGNYYDGQTTYNHAPPSLSYTVQQGIEFGHEVIDYSSSSGEVNYPLRLAADGCRQPNPSSKDAVYNCSIACVSPKDIFTHTPTMANCMTYGLIVEVLIHGNASDSFRQNATKYGISANRTIAHQIKSTILGCFNQCKSSESCGYTRETSTSIPDDQRYPNSTLYHEVSDMCLGVVAPVMTDIAGIGVGILVRSYERHKLTISARHISHTGFKAALRSRLLVY